MAKNHRIFIAFAAEDSNLRDFLVGQARNESSPFSFTDMSVKEPWDSQWKSNCRTKIKGCDGLIAIVTGNTPQATGQLWEVGCAIEEGVPTMHIYGSQSDRPSNLPAPIAGKLIYNWTWANIESFLDKL